MLRVFVALGKHLPKNQAMIEDTEEVAKLLAKYNCTMVQGGAKIGLMGVAVQEFQKYSDEVVMIVPEVHKSDLVGAKCKEHYIVEGESDRMRITIHTCDMMIVLPGGSGTLAEIAYYNETRKSGEHNARIVIVNTNGFYNKLFKFHKHQIKQGFMKEGDCQYDVIKNAKELEPIIQELITKKQAELQKQAVENAAKNEISTKRVKSSKSSNKNANGSKTSTKKETANKAVATKESAKKVANRKSSNKSIETGKSSSASNTGEKKRIKNPLVSTKLNKDMIKSATAKKVEQVGVKPNARKKANSNKTATKKASKSISTSKTTANK